MKPGKPLNPYAASFIPLCRRGGDDVNTAANIPIGDSKSRDETAKCKQATEGESRSTDILSGGSERHINVFNSNSENSMPKNPSDGNEKQTMVEDVELDLAYLSATFPGLSEQSLADVYFASDGDLEASIDMLSQLELTDTLDFGDKLDFGPMDEASMKQKMVVTGEASSSSGSSDWTSGLYQQ